MLRGEVQEIDEASIQDDLAPFTKSGKDAKRQRAYATGPS